MRVYRYPSTFAQKGVSRGRNLATEGVLAFSARATNSRPQDSSLCYPACFAQNAFSAPGHKYTLMLPHCVALGTPPRAQINKDSPTVLRCLYLIKRAWNKPNSSNSGGICLSELGFIPTFLARKSEWCFRMERCIPGKVWWRLVQSSKKCVPFDDSAHVPALTNDESDEIGRLTLAVMAAGSRRDPTAKGNRSTLALCEITASSRLAKHSKSSPAELRLKLCEIYASVCIWQLGLSCVESMPLCASGSRAACAFLTPLVDCNNTAERARTGRRTRAHRAKFISQIAAALAGNSGSEIATLKDQWQQ
ncbi:hypothetical protein Bbelb_306520 [Branchiostoma belcheri]|nr:hypothetical protein Bbelb_306520 [Branchiostoma belcheri]